MGENSDKLDEGKNDLESCKLDNLTKLIIVLSISTTVSFVGYLIFKSNFFVVTSFVGIAGLLLIGLVGSFRDL